MSHLQRQKLKYSAESKSDLGPCLLALFIPLACTDLPSFTDAYFALVNWGLQFGAVEAE